MKYILYLLTVLLLSALLPSCIQDGMETSPSSQPYFSVDTLDMGEFFTGQPTPTRRFTVHNPHSKILLLSSVRLHDTSDSDIFRINVDGFAGKEFSNVEIRPNDSIFVFVEATLPVNSTAGLQDVTADLDFTVNGVTSSVTLLARGQDVERKRGVTVTANERWEAHLPYQIFDSLIVAPGATLTLGAGVSMHFHDKTYMRVYGSLVTEGSPDAPVQMCGDRTDNVVGDISFDLMASQWTGLHFAPSSLNNNMSHTIVRNTSEGVMVDSLAQVNFHNCRLRNSASYSLHTKYADVTLTGCEIAEAADGLMAVTGGSLVANHCTFANYYLFAAIRGAALQFDHFNEETDNGSGLPFLKATITNSIVYGNGTDLSHGDLSGSEVFIAGTLLKSAGSDDDNFISCIWDTDPMFATVREDYFFDYRLLPESTVLGVADPSMTLDESALDFYGVSRLPAPNPGAYQMGATKPE